MLKGKVVACALGMSVISGSAVAGGVDFSGGSVIKLFEVGRFVQGTVTKFSIDFSGTDVGGQDTGQLMDDFTDFSFTYKQDINDKLSFAIIKDTPWFSQTSFKQGLFAGVDNKVESDGVRGLLRYKINDNVAVHGGVNVSTLDGQVTIPAGIDPRYPTGLKYSNTGDPSVSYIVGATYEIPKYHALVGLTYFSEADVTAFSTENGVEEGEFKYTAPDFFNLDFRFPVSKKDLVFGGVRFGRWDGYNITTPTGFEAVNSEHNSVGYTLGLAHRFSGKWVGFVRGGYEGPSGALQTVDDYYDGVKQLGVGATYTKNKTSVTGFINNVVTNERTGRIGAFDDGHAASLSLSVKQSF